MLDAMTMDQFQEWRAYFSLEPFGEERADLRAGVVASTVVNVNLPKGKKPMSPSDFVLFDVDEERGDRKPLTSPEAWKALKRQAVAFAGREKKKSPKRRRRNERGV